MLYQRSTYPLITIICSKDDDERNTHHKRGVSVWMIGRLIPSFPAAESNPHNVNYGAKESRQDRFVRSASVHPQKLSCSEYILVIFNHNGGSAVGERIVGVVGSLLCWFWMLVTRD